MVGSAVAIIVEFEVLHEQCAGDDHRGQAGLPGDPRRREGRLFRHLASVAWDTPGGKPHGKAPDPEDGPDREGERVAGESPPGKFTHWREAAVHRLFIKSMHSGWQ